MTSITSAVGVGSGLDINSIVRQIVTAESQPVMNAIQRQENTLNAHISSLGTLKSALSDFQTAIQNITHGNLFSGYAATSSDQSVLTASADSTASAGSHSITVNNLATTQRSVSQLGFSSLTTPVGTGTLTITNGSGSFNVTIDSANQTLAGIRDAINNSIGNNSVTASVITVNNATNTGLESHLVLTGKNTGSANGFTVSGVDNDGNQTDNAGLSSLFTPNMKVQTSAVDANISVDGFTVTSGSNTITSVLPGVSMNLQASGVGKTTNLNVTLDNSTITKNIADFVTAYNKFHSTAESLRKYGGAGGKSGDLLGDSTLNNLMSNIRSSISKPVSSMSQLSSANTLSSIGIKVDKNGVMSLDSNKLASALSNNPKAVSDIFNSTDGIATRIDTIATNNLSASSSISTRVNTYQARINSLETKRTTEQDRMAALQKSMLKQYSAMDGLVGQYQSIGSYLTNTFKSSSTG